MSMSSDEFDKVFGTAWHTNATAIKSRMVWITGVVTPVSAVVPDFIGQEYFDSVTAKFYKAVGLTNADWKDMTN